MRLFGWQEPKTCWVRSATDDPCGRPATVEILGVPFCEGCAREHEAYAAIGALTDPVYENDPVIGLREASLVDSLRTLRGRRVGRPTALGEKRLEGQRA